MTERSWTGRQQSKPLTPWHEAVRSANLSRVLELLESGSDINALDERGQTALMNAVIWKNLELAELLIKRGADLNRTAKLRLSALYLAVIRNEPIFLKLLLDAGADAALTGSTEQYSCTPQEYAQRHGKKELVEILGGS